MRPIRDPEGEEINHLVKACDLANKSILDIGCGDGKFTRQYAGYARSIIGIDPDRPSLHDAMNDNIAQFSHLCFVQTNGENLPFRSHSFDRTIFTSSL